MRLPLLMSVLIGAVLVAFLWAAYREVESAFTQNGGARTQVAAGELATLLAQSAQQRLTEAARAASDPRVRHYLQEPTAAALNDARQRLSPLAAVGQPAVELWNVKGVRVLTVMGPPAANRPPAATLPSDPPSSPELSPLHTFQDTVFSDVVAEVRDTPDAAAGSSSSLLGYLRTRRVLTVPATTDAIGRLVGNGAVVAIGNQTGDVWTDLSKIVAAPPVTVNRTAVATYRGADGKDRLGASAPVDGTPWAVWVEFPSAIVIAPAHTFLARMALIALCFVIGAAVLARVLSGHITTPLSDLTRAAEAIAGGRSSDRVAVVGRDEIGRLGHAFNRMAAQVQATQHNLEARIEQRLHELQSSREELNHFFSLSLDLLCIAGTDGYLKRVNPAWQATLGWAPDELTAKPYQEFIHPADVASTAAEAAKLSSGATTVSFENRYRCKDGSYRWLQWKAVPLPQQRVIYAAARDVTDQKRASQALQDHVGELASLNQELEAFSYSVSHDLRAPLRHVMGFATLLQEEAGPTLTEHCQRYIRTITEAAQQMGRLIDDLLAFSRMGRVPLAKGPLRLDDLVRDAQREVLMGTNGRRISWTVHPLPEVEADAAMLRLALVNLLSNALKYTATRPEAQIEIGAETTDAGETVLFVRDDGVGFDMQYAHKLFGVFQRLHRSEEFAGTGIGLANVRRIIQRHGGRVWASGEINRGATFYFSLPGKDRKRDDRVPHHSAC